jgi:hypothetical protein
VQSQAEPFYEFLEFLHLQDPTGEKSRTVTEIVEQHLIPEQEVAEEILHTTPSPDLKKKRGRCGDGSCDELEQKDPSLCPQDCDGIKETKLPEPEKGKRGKCGDGICDALEQKNPTLCPGDCQ